METNDIERTRFLQPTELDLVTEKLMLWCEKHGRDPLELLRNSSIILDRWRNGHRDDKALFQGL